MVTLHNFKACAGLIALVACSAAQPAETLRYLLLTSDGSQGGEQVVERADDGATTVRYRFKNNGRGPEFIERIRVAKDGLPSSYENQGTSTMGAPIDERFERSADSATWRSTSEQGAATVAGPVMYVPLNGSFEVASMSLGALGNRPDATLPLLPSGTLTQRVLDEAEVAGPGRTRRVQLVAQTGLGLQPSFYWATVEARPRLFASIYPGWMTAIEDGWAANAGMLATRQRVAEGKLLKELSAKIRQPMPGLSVVRNARVFDSETATLGEPADIYILRGRITAVLPAGTSPRPADNEVDAAGRIVLPGLFDMHGHVDRWDGGLHLAAGVTTVRDMGNDNAKLQQMLDETGAGELLLPQVVPCGFLEGDSPHAHRWGIVIKTLQEAKEAVDWYALRGYPQLKIYNSFPRDMVPEIVAYAHARNLRVSGHVPVTMRAQDVVEQGFDELQHINQVMLNFLVTPSTDTRTLERFYLPAEKVAGLDLDGKPVQDFIALLKARGTVVDPTLATFDFLRQRDGDMAEPYLPIVANLPPDVQRWFKVGSMKIPDAATAARYNASYAKMVEFVGRLHKAGVPLLAGTDAIAGFTLHSELALYVKAGLSPAQVLQIATRDASHHSGTTPDRGRIAVGKRADLVLVDGNPLANIADLRNVALVVTQGNAISPNAVHQALGVAPFVKNPPTLKRIEPAAGGVRVGDGSGQRHGPSGAVHLH